MPRPYPELGYLQIAIHMLSFGEGGGEVDDGEDVGLRVWRGPVHGFWCVVLQVGMVW